MKKYFFLVLFFPLVIFSQQRVEAEGKCIIANITPEMARERALKRAMSEAVSQVTGITVTESVLRNLSDQTAGEENKIFDVFSRLSNATSSGRVLEYDILYEDTKREGEALVYTIGINALVAEDEGKPDPDFKVSIDIDKSVYFYRGEDDSDEISFSIEATEKCYIYLFNIMTTDSVQLILPNIYIKDNLFDPGLERQNFEMTMDEFGMTFPVELGDGKQHAVEALYLVALKDKIDFAPELNFDPGSGIIPTWKTAITEISKWLMEIPAERRTEHLVQFEIRRM